MIQIKENHQKEIKKLEKKYRKSLAWALFLLEDIKKRWSKIRKLADEIINLTISGIVPGEESLLEAKVAQYNAIIKRAEEIISKLD